MRRSENEPLLFDLPMDRPARRDANDANDANDSNNANDENDAGHLRDVRDQAGRGAAGGGKSGDRRLTPRGQNAPAGSAAANRAAKPGKPPAPAPQAPPSRERRAAPMPMSDPPRTAALADEVAGLRHISLGRRAAGGAADLVVHLAVLILAVCGCRYLGVLPVLRDWPAFLVFLLAFSFLYTVVPLAFWGHTLGMTWAGLTAESTDGEPLSFEQTARRWLGALITLAVVGLPLLVALGGRSLADRLSDSRTLLAAGLD
jgi:uncharacterized RDD family membrane protein YckC